MTVEVWVRKGWLFWQAIDPHETLGLFEMSTVFRSWTKEGAMRKARRRPKPRWTRVGDME